MIKTRRLTSNELALEGEKCGGEYATKVKCEMKNEMNETTFSSL